MKLRTLLVGSVIVLSLSNFATAQSGIENICKIENNRIVFTIDTRWTDEQKKQVSEKFLLDSLIIENALKELPEFFFDSVQWKTEKLNAHFVILYKNLQDDNEEPFNKYDMIYLINPLTNTNASNTYSQKKYGINNFSDPSCFIYKDSVAKFFLRGYLEADNIFISGTFNEWSTLETPMQKNDSGWQIRLKLKPGKYLYKYIINGRWTIDPANKTKEANEHGTSNSVVYANNHTFKLKGYNKAKKVYVSGVFNNWRHKEIAMLKTHEGWELPLFFYDGSYSYKYVVDRKWIIDPDNPLTRKDSNGNLNSYFEIGNKVTINLAGYSDAEKIILSGSFNNWNNNELLMEKTDSGWQIAYVLGDGNFEYKYIVDGSWIIDTINPYTIYTGGYQNSVLSVNPNYTFVLKHFPDAENVIVTGSFNNWNTTGYTMKKENGIWIIPLFLNKGKHLYKFIVDGKWIIDPDNPIWENNEVGTGNSVLWIK